MEQRKSPSRDQWMRLSEAADYIGVHFTTLRRWSEAGRILHYKTPGGRRRYKKSDLDLYLKHSQEGDRIKLLPASTGMVSPKIIREIKQLGFRKESWYGQIAPERQRLMAESGRRLIGSLMQYAGREDGTDAYLQQGKELAWQYGVMCRASGLSESQTLQIFVNIRHSIVDSLCEAGMVVQDSGEDTWKIYRRVNYFLDLVMITMLNSFQDGSSTRNDHADQNGADWIDSDGGLKHPPLNQ